MSDWRSTAAPSLQGPFGVARPRAAYGGAQSCAQHYAHRPCWVANATGVANHNRPPLNPRQQRKWPRERSRDQQRKRRTERRQRGRKRRLRRGGGSRGQARKPRQHWRSGQKKTQPIRVGFLVNGGGMVPRIKRLLKVRNRSAAGCCELVRTGSKSLPVRLSAVDDQAGFSP